MRRKLFGGIAGGLLSALILTSAPLTASAATGSPSSASNLSDNPILASSLSGYSIQEGATKLTRVSVTDHVVAKYAASVTSNATVTRVRAPKEPVQPGEKWTFAADVKASKTGATGQVTVSWYSSSGAFISYGSGVYGSLSATNWTRREAVLIVPSGAAFGETVINVSNTAKSATVRVTQHDVRAPVVVPSPTPTPTPSDTPSPTVTPSESVTPSPSETASPTETPSPSPTPSESATPSPSESNTPSPTPSETPTPQTITNLPGQPAITAYQAASAVTPFSEKGALIIAGRDNYNQQPMKDASEAGATVLIYLDVIIDNPYGRYHELLHKSSECGPATVRWPGEPKANEWGYLTDFRVGSAANTKLTCVLEKMVAENPHMGGFFADDLGSRSWYPGFSWDNWGATNQQAYRTGAIALAQIFHDVAVKHGLMVMVNGTWGAGSLAGNGGGYPDMNKHGLSLADGGYIEGHPTNQLQYWVAYSQPGQWATAPGSVAQGKPFMYVQATDTATRDAYNQAGVFSFLSAQAVYETASVWGPFHPTGLPTKVTN